MVLNLNNIESLIFFDKKIHALLPNYRHLFDQWQIGQRMPGMKTLAQRSVIEFMNMIDADSLKILEEYFNEFIVIDKLDNKTISHYTFDIEKENELCKFVGYKDFFLTRNKNKVSISFWR